MSKENKSSNGITDWCEEVKKAKWEENESTEYVLEQDKAYIDELIKEDENKNNLWGIKKAWEKHNLYQLPHLFSGDLENAKIIVLIANPGDKEGETEECRAHFEERKELLTSPKSQILSEKMGKDTHGWSWTRRTYMSAFWTEPELEKRIIGGDFDTFFPSCKDSDEFRKQLKEYFSLDENTSAKFIEKMEEDNTSYKLSSIYKKVKKKRGTKGLLHNFIQQMHIGLINRYVASAEYYPYHSKAPQLLSFKYKGAASGKGEYCMPSTKWIINQISNRIKDSQSSSEESSFKQQPLIIIPRKSGQELWIKQDKALKKDRYSISVEKLDDYDRVLVTTGKGNARKNNNLFLRPENLRSYQNKQVDEETNDEAKKLLGKVLDEIVDEMTKSKKDI
ncbi:MAG: hypothetical protein SPD80_01225 [Atopobium sp.]|uniref:hypothetical protein n=1 Tax=Atopobium sp. TaxID=1872650 RepID=UPI002A7FDEEC|nr:hypothetical protein [Atopobium sp.]MDY4522201.1 hypothetical protein [Atopobium sp.]